VPVFRSHGEIIKREIFEIAKPGTPVYNILAQYDRLRYRLLPYIYSLAGDTWQHAGTMMRGLVMDFPNDSAVRNIADEYMFGPAFLVAPVTEYKAMGRKVYLPAGSRWYDFHTGQAFDGGQTIDASAPLDRLPVFVKEGSIVPTGPQLQYTGEKRATPILLTVYSGKDGKFELYEDDGKSNGYQKGQWSRIAFTWNEATGTLTIGDRKGAYAGMPESRVFNVRFISGPNRYAVNFDAAPVQSVRYTGQAIDVHRNAAKPGKAH
jgi:alpha-D-xyloside xylohydrolase